MAGLRPTRKSGRGYGPLFTDTPPVSQACITATAVRALFKPTGALCQPP